MGFARARTTRRLLSNASIDVLTHSLISSRFPNMTRFFAHLCLFLQMIDIPVPPLATQVILEAYLQVLEVNLISLR